MKTIRSISAGSVFKVSFVIYALLFAIFGCFFLVLPAVLGQTFLSQSFVPDIIGNGQRLGFLSSGGAIAAVVVAYVVGIFVVALIQGIFAAIAALVYNLVSGLVGGVRVDLSDQ